MFDMCDNIIIRSDSRSRVVHLLAERLIDVLIIRSSEEAAKTAPEIEEIRKGVLSTFINDEGTKNIKYMEFIENLGSKNGSRGTFTFNIKHMFPGVVDGEKQIDQVDCHQKLRLIKVFFRKVFKNLIFAGNTQLSNQRISYDEVIGGKAHYTFHEGSGINEDLHIYFQQVDVNKPEIEYYISTKEI